MKLPLNPLTFGWSKRNNLEIYKEHANEWWNEQCFLFRSLQSVSKFRLQLIRRWCGEIAGQKVADLGGGGGFLSIPLKREGAFVADLDISLPSLQAAARQADEKGWLVQADFRRLPFGTQSFDVVLLADVLDHLPDYETVVDEASRILKPGGLLYVSTISRTWRSWLLAIVLAENIGLVPRGTHDHRLFITPKELMRTASRAGFQFVEAQGEAPAVLQTIFSWSIHFRPSRSTAVAYSAFFRKNCGV